MSSKANNFSELILDLINPCLCLVCEVPITKSNSTFLVVICLKCQAQMPIAPNGAEIINIISKNFKSNDFYLDSAYSLIDIRKNSDYLKIIHALKYYSMTKIADIFGAELSILIKKSGIKYDYLIPVPIHLAKERERGFNQSLLIANKISEETGIPVINELIKRHKYTTSQTLLTNDERKENIKNIYSIDKLEIEINHKNFLIIDDVLTTGSTINNIAAILKMNNSEIVDCATIAFA
jgi:competence protein ComFC